DECSNYLGRSCAANTLTDSGSFDSRNGGTALNMIKGVSTCVNYKPDAAETTSGSQQQQQQQSSQSNESQQQSSQASDTTQQQQSSQNSDSEQQQRVQTSGSVQQESQSRKLAVQTSDLEKEWQQTTGNFGVGKLE
ncbi:hypothetical protein L917_15414, partial [Phytophthora nicotianae]